MSESSAERDADELDLANVGLVTLTEGDIEAMRLAVSTVVDEVDVSGLYDAEPDDDIPTRVTSPGAIHANGCNVEHTDAGGCRRDTPPGERDSASGTGRA